MSLRWTSHEEMFLIEHLELGYDLDWITAVLDRTILEAAMKVVELYHEGTVMIMAGRTYDAQIRRNGE
jgi:hypothetical protein